MKLRLLSNNLRNELRVTQDLISGPTLFPTHINSLGDSLGHFLAILYAEDTNIFIKSVKKKIHTINHESTVLTDWGTANKLMVNTQKHAMVC